MTKVMSVVFVLLIFELIIFGPVGIVVSDVSIRKLLIVTLLLMSAWKALIVGSLKTWQLGYLYGLVCLLIVWGGIVPLQNGVAQAASIAEVTPLVGLFLILPIQILFERYGFDYYLVMVRWATFALAWIVIMTWSVAYLLDRIDLGLVVRDLYVLINETDAGIFIGPMSDGSFRVMVIGCMVFPLLLAYHNWKQFSFGWSLFYFLAIYASGTRAFLIAGICILVFVLLKSRPVVALVGVLLGAALYPLLATTLEGKRIFEFANELTMDSARYVQFFALKDLFLQNIFFGAGFGAQAAVIRSETAPYSYELTYVALLSKLGLVGAALVLCAAGKTTFRVLRNVPGRRGNILSILLAFIAMTATNPYLINSLGMTVLAFFICLSHAADQRSLSPRIMKSVLAHGE